MRIIGLIAQQYRRLLSFSWWTVYTYGQRGKSDHLMQVPLLSKRKTSPKRNLLPSSAEGALCTVQDSRVRMRGFLQLKKYNFPDLECPENLSY